MDFVEVEAKTYEEAIRKAAAQLNAEEKDLDIDVKEVDTKGILGLLGSKKIRITACLRKEEPIFSAPVINTAEEEATPVSVEREAPSTDSLEEYGKSFLEGMGTFIDLPMNVHATRQNDRLVFLIQGEDGDVLIGKDGEVLDALQYLLRLAIAKRYKQGLRLLIDINGYRERRKKSLTTMARRLADKAKRTGRSIKTDPLNPYERRIIHTLFKHNKNISTKSEGEGHTKKVVISHSRSTK